MKIVYMGTPDFAVPSLTALINAGHEVGYVITQPDAVRDRGKKIHFPAVKEKALELGLRVLQPEKVKKNTELVELLQDYAPDVIAVAAYGQILPETILEIPRLGCINVHGSLLPKLRGAAPIQRAILDGEEETGITIMYMEKGLDTGDMLATCRTPIGRKNAAQLHDELAHLGAELLVHTLTELEKGTAVPQKQKEEEATYAPMISKKDGELDFTDTPEALERRIRAFDPWPGAYTKYKGGLLKIWQAEISEKPNESPAGMITAAGPDGIEISAGGKTLIATMIQLPGKKRVAVREYLKGNVIETGSFLG